MQTDAAFRGQFVVCVCTAIALATVDYYNKPSIIYVVFHFASLPFNGFSKFGCCCFIFYFFSLFVVVFDPTY